MQTLGTLLTVIAVGFFIYWNGWVAGESLPAGSWQYTYDALPGSTVYPIILGIIGSVLYQLGGGKD